MNEEKQQPDQDPQDDQPKPDLLKCAFCGNITEGFNEFLECPKCGEEGPGCWTQDFHFTFKNNQKN